VPKAETMKQDFLQLLQDADSSIFIERPFGFSIKKADAKFNNFVEALEQKLDCSLPEKENYMDIQDGGFHGMVFLPVHLLKEEERISVRVSNFGNFATAYDDDSIVLPEVLLTIVATQEEFGYIYIPSKILNMPYTGKNRGVDGFNSWGHRYFDWT
jgi:hypothetical protein